MLAYAETNTRLVIPTYTKRQRPISRLRPSITICRLISNLIRRQWLVSLSLAVIFFTGSLVCVNSCSGLGLGSIEGNFDDMRNRRRPMT